MHLLKQVALLSASVLLLAIRKHIFLTQKLQISKLRVKRKNNVIFWEISFIYKKLKISPENAFYQKYSIFSWCCNWILWYMFSFKYILTIVKIDIDFHQKLYSYNRREVSFKNEAMVKLKCILNKKNAVFRKLLMYPEHEIMIF